MNTNTIQMIAIYAMPVLLAITVHEASHAYAAKYCGDNTAFRAGRMTLNPLKHIDFLGTIVLPLLTISLGGGLFGWAKPVPVNFGALNHPKRDMVLVAMAGPLSNFLMAIFWGLLHKLSLNITSDFSLPLMLMSQAGMQINYVLMVFNLLPILPLDGGRIAQGLMPRRYAYSYARTESYGMWILIALIVSGLLYSLLRPFTDYLITFTAFILQF